MKTKIALLGTVLALSPHGIRADLPVSALVLSDDPAPAHVGDETYSFFTFASGSPNPANVAFGAFLNGSGVTGDTDVADFAGFPGPLAMVAREGYPPSLGSGNSNVTFLRAPSINASGTALAWGSMSGAQPLEGVFRRSAAGVFEMLAQTGQPIAGETSLFFGSTVFGNRMSIDSLGRGYINGSLTGSNVDNSNLYGIFRAAPGDIDLLVRRGVTPPPGVVDLQNNIRFSIFSYLNANAPGDIAFQASLSNAAVNADTGIWATRNGTLQLVVREGDTAPGLGAVGFFQLNGAVGIGDEGTIGFGATLTGSGVTDDNKLTLWKVKNGAFTLLAREGDPVPGFDPGVVYDSFYETSLETGPALNPYGNAAFIARLRGPGITTSNDDTLWVEDGNGVRRLVIREGSLLPGPGGTTAPIGSSLPNALVPFNFHPIGGFASKTRLIFLAETAAGNHEGVYAAAVPDRIDSIAPTLRISGAKSRRSRGPVARITGTASDDTRVARVEGRVGPSAYRAAAGTLRWTYRARVRAKRNVVSVRARDTAGNLSRPAIVIVRRA